jgi:hypothetical protein
VKKILFFVVAIFILSCQKKAENETCKATDSLKTDKFEMYQMSEMAALMEQMYVDNKQVKNRILNGETLGKFPEHFLKIHTAKFTDESDNDSFFKVQAAKYIEAQKLIYSDTLNAKEHFNAGVDACLKCHEQKCGGPIPRIKKLYIK